MLQTFCEKRFVVRDEQSHTYKLGPALISLGRTAAENISIQDAARPILKHLTTVTEEDSYLIIPVGSKGLVLEKMDGPNHLKVVEKFGYELDMPLRSHPQGSPGLSAEGIYRLLHHPHSHRSARLSQKRAQRSF